MVWFDCERLAVAPLRGFGIALGENGADLIEIGIPYSDPVMDGAVIQQATTEALANGFHVAQVFDVVRGITSRTDAAVLVMTYWNPVVRMGVDEFSRRLADAELRHHGFILRSP